MLMRPPVGWDDAEGVMCFVQDHHQVLRLDDLKGERPCRHTRDSREQASRHRIVDPPARDEFKPPGFELGGVGGWFTSERRTIRGGVRSAKPRRLLIAK